MGLNGKNRAQPQALPHPRSSSPRSDFIEARRIARELIEEFRAIGRAPNAPPLRENSEQHQRDLEEYDRQNPPRRRRYH